MDQLQLIQGHGCEGVQVHLLLGMVPQNHRQIYWCHLFLADDLLFRERLHNATSQKCASWHVCFGWTLRCNRLVDGQEWPH